MKVEYLVNQAKKYVSYLTDNFSDTIKIKKVEVINGLFTITTEEDLNAKKGDEAVLFLKNIPIRIDIDSIEKISSDEAIMITKQNHDQTKDPKKKYKVFIDIQGCKDELYNGKTEILEDYQDGGYKLRLKVNKDTTEEPDVSNAFFYIITGRGNGFRRVKIIDKNVFTFQESDTKLNFTVENNDSMYISMNTRIYPAYDFIDAKAQYSKNLQRALEEDKIFRENKPLINIKKPDQYTAFIALNQDVKNTAANDTSIGYYTYNFSVFIFIMHRDIDKYKIRNMEDYLTHAVFNKIFGDKTIKLADNIISVPETQRIKFLGSRFAEPRENDKSIFELQYEFMLETFAQDYELPRYDVRLNEIDLEVTNGDSKLFTNVDILL